MSYIQKKHNTAPRVLRMYEAKDDYYCIPYHVAYTAGFKPVGVTGSQFPWYCIQPLLINDTQNIWDIDKTSQFHRPFIGVFREYQGDIINELLEHLNQYCSTTVGLPPGWGKTMAGIFLSWRLGLRTLIMMSLAIVLKGWITTCRTFIPHFKFWVVVSGEECPEDVDVILCMDERFKHIPKHIVSTVGTLIVDEAHLMCTETRLDIYLYVFPKYVILESATIRKKKAFRKIAHLMAGEHGVFRVSKRPYNIFIVETGIMGTEERQKNGDLISAKLRADVALNEFRQDLICMMLMQNCNHNKFMSRRSVKAGIPELVNKIKNCGITCDAMFGTKGDYENSQVLVGTWQKMGTGFDESTACKDFSKNPNKSNVMIFEDFTEDEELYEQNRGRVMRLTDKKKDENGLDIEDDEEEIIPAVIILEDLNASSIRLVNSMKPWFKETNGTVYRVKPQNLILPRTKQTFSRQMQAETFYRVCTVKDYNLFKDYHIIDMNDYDRELGGFEIFNSAETLLAKYNTPGLIVITLTYLNVSTDGRQYISTCPICSFQILSISQI